MVYVPVYDPLYVYGPWWYPAYPPCYWYYPYGYVISGGYISYGPRIFLIGWYPWAWFDWHGHHFYVDDIKQTDSRHYDNRDFDRHTGNMTRAIEEGLHTGTGEQVNDFRPRPGLGHPTSPETRGYPGRRIDPQEGRPSRGSC